MVAAGGPVLPSWEAPPPKWLLEFMGDAKTFGILSLMEPYDSFRVAHDGVFFGVNMAIPLTLRNYVVVARLAIQHLIMVNGLNRFKRRRIVARLTVVGCIRMVNGFTDCQFSIVTGCAGSQHFIVIHGNDRFKSDGCVAGFAFVRS